MKHLQTFEGFIKNYGQKMTLEDFEKIPVDSEIVYRGTRMTVTANNKTTITAKPKSGSPVMINLNMFNEFGAITESFESYLFEGYMSELDILRQESKTVEEFIKKAKQEFPEIKNMKDADLFLHDLWRLSDSMD